MKKAAINITTCIVFSVLLFAGHSVFAQEKGSMEIGPGIVYGEDIEKMGLKVDGYYTINEQFRAGLDLTYFFPESQTVFGTDITTNFFTVDALANYFFYSSETISAYGIGGLNLAFASVKIDDDKESESEFGLTLGAGGEYALDFGAIFAELRFAGIGGDADQFVLGAGVRFGI